VIHCVYCHEDSSSCSAAKNVIQNSESPLLQNYASSSQTTLFVYVLSALFHVLSFHNHHKHHAHMNVVTNPMCSKSDVWCQFLLTIQETGLQPHYAGLCIVKQQAFIQKVFGLNLSCGTSYLNWCFFIVFLSPSRKKFQYTTLLSHSYFLLILSSSSAVVLDWNT